MDRLVGVMAQLRQPEGGCPWDVEQTFETIAPYTIEEAYEVADAVERGDMHDLKDELGDVLFQVVFHARMAEEAGHFDFGDVATSISDKMISRHPHVFGDAKIDSAEAQTEAWEEFKAKERGEQADNSALAGITPGLPEWMKAMKLHSRAARVGFDWPNPDAVLDKLEEETQELRDALGGDIDDIEDELGDVLFVAMNLARQLKLDAGKALRRANRKFESRFRGIEKLAEEQGTELKALSLDEQEALWQQVKRERE